MARVLELPAEGCRSPSPRRFAGRWREGGVTCEPPWHVIFLGKSASAFARICARGLVLERFRMPSARARGCVRSAGAQSCVTIGLSGRGRNVHRPARAIAPPQGAHCGPRRGIDGQKMGPRQRRRRRRRQNPGLAEAPRRPRREAPETAEARRGARPLLKRRGVGKEIHC